MNKAELVGAIADKTKVSRVVVDQVTSALLEVVIEQISAGRQVRLVGFGTWVSRVAKARAGRNPRTGEQINIPARVVPHFKAGTAFKESVNG
jgi:DNA-binding protein HU-beta